MHHLARTANDIGHAIRSARKALGMTQAELATSSGIWQETISKIENGSSGTKLETVFDLCAALDLELVVTKRTKGNVDQLEELF